MRYKKRNLYPLNQVLNSQKKQKKKKDLNNYHLGDRFVEEVCSK